MSHPQFEAVQEVFRQAVPVLRQALPMLEKGLHAEPEQRRENITIYLIQMIILSALHAHLTSDLG